VSPSVHSQDGIDIDELREKEENKVKETENYGCIVRKLNWG
jgi:hypothetical protein